MPRRGRTGKIRTRRDRAHIAAVTVGLAAVLLVGYATIDSWALRIGVTVLGLLLAPVLLTVLQPTSHRRVH